MNIPTAPFCEQCGAANEPQATICSVCAHPLHTPRTTNDATEHESLLAETLLKGRYRIIKAVGQGGMALTRCYFLPLLEDSLGMISSWTYL